MANKKNNGKMVSRVIKHRHGVRAKLHETQQALKMAQQTLERTVAELAKFRTEHDVLRPTLSQAELDVRRLSEAVEVLARRAVRASYGEPTRR